MERVNPIRVVVLPWLGFGHLMPFFELSLALAKAGVHVSYVSTPKNIQKLPKIPSTLSPLINLVPLPFPADSDAAALLRELGGGESTADLPNEKVPLLMKAYDLLQKPFKQFIAQQSPDWIVIDFIPYWGVNVGQELGIPVVIFSAFSAAAMVFWGPPEYLCGDGRKRVRSSPESMVSPPWWVGFPSSVAYRSHEAFGAHFWFYTTFGSDLSISERIAKALHGCQALAVRSCREVEGDYLNSLANFMCNKQVIPVGVLPPQQKNDNTGGAPTIFKWLDQQKPKSVLFVGFGSEGNKLSKEQIYEMAHGIEASEIPFMWALAKPSWAADDDALPPGFDGRTSQRGRVHIGWVPQNEILSHPSIGGSLFHAGWGSVIENLQFGHCLVVLPFIVDQFLNARLLVEMGLAIEVERRGDGSICREDIAESLKKAMVYKEAEIMREKVRKVAQNFQDRKLQDDLAAFIDYLKNGVAPAG